MNIYIDAHGRHWDIGKVGDKWKVTMYFHDGYETIRKFAKIAKTKKEALAWVQINADTWKEF